MAAGVELAADAVEPFRARPRRARRARRSAPEDLIPVERVDAVVPGGALGLDLAEELERLRPFGMGNPQPTPARARRRASRTWPAMGEERQHARFTLVTAGGARSRGVAFGSPPEGARARRGRATTTSRSASSATAGTAWWSRADPARALPDPARASCGCSARSGAFWERLGASAWRRRPRRPSPPPVAGPPAAARPPRRGLRRRGRRPVHERRARCWSAWPTSRAGASRSRRSWPGWRRMAMAVASWDSARGRPALAGAFDHLVALDPPPGGAPIRCCASAARAHLAWGPAEAEFALRVWRAELDLRPALASVYRALRELAAGGRRRGARAGARAAQGRYPRAPGPARACRSAQRAGPGRAHARSAVVPGARGRSAPTSSARPPTAPA